MPMGWECPRCMNVVSPYLEMCPQCEKPPKKPLESTSDSGVVAIDGLVSSPSESKMSQLQSMNE